jgi:uncharacterized membrane-anchored protein YjiN (DUF445 family)
LDQELAQRRLLRRNRTIATGLLVAMAILFLITGIMPEPGFWWQLVHAVSEASVVGGLADWFAVTAVFRQPLGLPIPHTAIVPRNKDRIGEGLASFLQRHFLTDENLLAKVRTLDPACRLAIWMTSPRRADAVADHFTSLLPHIVRALDDDEIRVFTAKAMGEQLREVDAAPLLSRGIELLAVGGYHAAILDQGIEFGLDFLDRNAERMELAAASGERRRWWIPKAADQQIAHALLEGLRDLLLDLSEPEHNARKKLLKAIDNMARELATSPQHSARVEEAKRHLLEHPEVQEWLASLWDQIRDAVLADLGSPTPKTRQAVATAVDAAGRRLLGDEHMRSQLNGLLERIVVAVLPWRAELGHFIAEVVHRWDERALVERMELVLGADLHYVRITGTLVGGIIGCALFLLSLAFH